VFKESYPEREREGGGEEVQESCGKAWHGLEELRGYRYTLHIIAFSSSTSICCHSFCIASLDLSLLI